MASLTAWLLPSAATAAPAWLTPVSTLTGTTSSSLFAPRVAVDAGGDTVIAWSDSSGNVFVSERPVHGAFSMGTQIPSSGFEQFGSVAIDDSGLEYVFMLAGASQSAALPYVATKQIGGSTWTQTPLATAIANEPVFAPISGAVSPNGAAVAIWELETSPNTGAQSSVLKFATKAAGSSTWSATGTVTNSGDQGDFSHPGNGVLAIDPAGDAALEFDRVGTTYLWGTTLPAGSSTWTSANKLSSNSSSLGSLAIDSSGNATAVWTRMNTAGNTILQFATKALSATSWPAAPAGTTSVPGTNDLSPLGGNATMPAIAVEPDGTTSVGWVQDNSAIDERTRAPGGSSFNTPTAIPTTLSSPQGLSLVPGSDGSMAALWSGLNGSAESVVGAASRAPAGVSFSAAPDLPGSGNSQPSGAADNLGNVSVAWNNQAAASAYQPQATGLIAPPAISDVNFPATADPGQSFTYGATVTDRWTATASLWAFGDGTTGPLTGTKSYATAGAYTATLTASDSLGGQSTVTRPITVGNPGAGTTTTTGTDTTTTTSPTGGAENTASIPAVISAVRLSPSKFAALPSGATVLPAKVARGTTVSYSDSETATTKFTVQKRAKGVRKGRSCVAPPRKRKKGQKPCTRYVTVGSFTHADAAGPNKFRFSGRLRGHRLAPGNYRFRIVAKNAAGQSSKAVTVSFRIVRR